MKKFNLKHNKYMLEPKRDLIADLLNGDEKQVLLKREYFYASEKDFQYLVETSVFLIIKYGIRPDVNTIWQN